MALPTSAFISSHAPTSSVRFGRQLWEQLRSHLQQDPNVEQFAFALASQAATPGGKVLIVKDLLLPDEDDLQWQSAGGVTPTPSFQGYAYLLARELGLSIIDIHTHTHRGLPHFSSIDHAESEANAHYINQHFEPPITHGLIVFGNDVQSHDGMVLDRATRTYQPLDRIDVLGRGMEIHSTAESIIQSGPIEEIYDRQARIPDWNQRRLAQLHLSIGGIGGNGSQLLQSLVGLGACRNGSLTLIDPQLIDSSNLPRIPYAFAEDVGSPKITVAAQYSCQKSPGTPVHAFHCSVAEPIVLPNLCGSHLLYGASDNDGVREILNEVAVRCLIPLIDMGCDLQLNDAGEYVGGGQVRIVIPGETACLVCTNGIDLAQAAIDLMDKSSRAQHAAQGYLVGAEQVATPSVNTLNSITAQMALNALLSLVQGATFGSWDYAHFDQRTGQIMTARTKPRASCPVCGKHGFLAAGFPQQDEITVGRSTEPNWMPPLALPEASSARLLESK
jgi:molybdopterin/thiamine biosynthesis adenylyltransferase